MDGKTTSSEISSSPNLAAAEQEPVRLAVAIPTKDVMRTLPQVLASIEGLADRIVVVDSGSTDGTMELAREKGCIVIERGASHAERICHRPILARPLGAPARCRRNT